MTSQIRSLEKSRTPGRRTAQEDAFRPADAPRRRERRLSRLSISAATPASKATPPLSGERQSACLLGDDSGTLGKQSGRSKRVARLHQERPAIHRDRVGGSRLER